jgi:hypothetical protein
MNVRSMIPSDGPQKAELPIRDWKIEFEVRSRRDWRDCGKQCSLMSEVDSLDHDLVLQAVAHHIDQRWILLYVERWLKAPLQHADGTPVPRDRGTPQGSAISPAEVFHHQLSSGRGRAAPPRAANVFTAPSTEATPVPPLP